MPRTSPDFVQSQRQPGKASQHSVGAGQAANAPHNSDAESWPRQPKSRTGKLFPLNASREFTKGDPKNFSPDDAIARIADAFTAWREGEKFSRIVPVEEIAKNDYTISPSRYIHTGAADEYRPLVETMEELEVLEEEAKETDAVLKRILAKLTA